MENIDRELILKAKNGDAECVDTLFFNYTNLAKKLSRRYFLIDGDPDDLFQEAMIGLFKALQKYDINSKADFKTFATLCINRQLQTAIKTSNRLKNKALSEALSLNNQGAIEIRGEDSEIWFVIPSKNLDAENELISRETTKEMLSTISKLLSDFEKHVLRLYLDGKSYKEISEAVDKSTKSVENALTRIKTKLSVLKN